MKLYIDTKPTLEWEKHTTISGDAEIWIAKIGIFKYEVVEEEDFWHYTIWVEDDGDTMCLHVDTPSTLSQAKAAAQADYDRRTAERFKEVEVPESLLEKNLYEDGYGYYISILELQSAIDKAREGKL